MTTYRHTAWLPVVLLAGACASIAPATLRLSPGVRLVECTFQVDSVRYQGSDRAGAAAATNITRSLTEQLTRRGYALVDTQTTRPCAVAIRGTLAGYATGSAAARLVFGAGVSPSQCVLRTTLVDRATDRVLGEMVTTQESGGRLSSHTKCAYSVADALDKATGRRSAH